MKKIYPFGLVLVLFVLVSLACDLSSMTTPGLENTKVALAIQQTSLAIEQAGGSQPNPPVTNPEQAALPTYTPYPTFTPQVPQPQAQPQQEQPQQAPPTVTFTPTVTQTQPSELFQNVSVDRLAFYCVPFDGPTTLTITVEMSDVDRGASLFWRLHEKANGNKLDWEIVDMRRAGGNTRSYTFDADSWNGTNNFFYPPLMFESWFEFQIISNDGAVRTEVFSDVTFYPCAQ